MKHLSLLAVLFFATTLLATCAQFSYADSIPTFYVTDATMHIGLGGDVSFVLTGPGVNITGLGAMACFDWCQSAIPDPSVASPSQIYPYGYGTVVVGGTTYDPSTLGIDLFSADGGLNESAIGTVGFGDPVFTFNLVLPNGGWGNFKFDPILDENGNTLYLLEFGTYKGTAIAPTPEPGTVALMLTGIVAIAGVIKRKAIALR